MVREDEVRVEVPLEVLESFLDQFTLERQEAVAKSVDRDLAGPDAVQEDPGRLAGLLDPDWIFASQYDPPDLDLRVGLGETQDSAAGADFDIIAVGTQAEEPFHASYVQNR